jgi:hypothetical protein
MKKEARAMEKAILANIPDFFMCEKSGLELSLALAARPLGSLAAERKLTGQNS